MHSHFTFIFITIFFKQKFLQKLRPCFINLYAWPWRWSRSSLFPYKSLLLLLLLIRLKLLILLILLIMSLLLFIVIRFLIIMIPHLLLLVAWAIRTSFLIFVCGLSMTRMRFAPFWPTAAVARIRFAVITMV